MRLRTTIKTVAARFGLGIFDLRNRYTQDGLFTVHGDHFRADPEFRAAYGRGIQASHGVDPAFEWRIHIAIWAARAGLGADGEFVECGVNAGFVSSAIMSALRWNTVGRRFYLIDTFTGPVVTQYSEDEVRADRATLAIQALNAGAYVTDMDRVRANFAEWPNAIVVQGSIPEDFERTDIGTVAFLHIDMNCVLPELAAFEYFWERLSPGAFVLFDDYAYYGHDHQRKSIDVAARARGAEVLTLPTGQGLIMK
jgi:hypothetical protein